MLPGVRPPPQLPISHDTTITLPRGILERTTHDGWSRDAVSTTRSVHFSPDIMLQSRGFAAVDGKETGHSLGSITQSEELTLPVAIPNVSEESGSKRQGQVRTSRVGRRGMW